MFVTSLPFPLLFNLISGFVLLLSDSFIIKKNNTYIAHVFQKWHNWIEVSKKEKNKREEEEEKEKRMSNIFENYSEAQKKNYSCWDI